MSDEQPFYVPGHHRTIAPATPKPGEEVWRLRKESGTRTGELRNDERGGFGWDVQVLEDGELVYSRRCANEQGARFVAECFREDSLRAGWIE
jgi:hypothetical protein